MNTITRAAVAAICLTVFTPDHSAAAEEVKGKDVVAAGTVKTLAGTLKPEGNHDWLLITDDGTYELHLGPEKYRESKQFTLTEGVKAEVRGFVHEKHVAPITITTEKGSIALRTEEGKSAWAGSELSRKKE